MIEIGKFHDLSILRHTSVGVFLGDPTTEGEDILLPNKYVPMIFKLGDLIHVFVYLDHEERIVATTLQPKIIREEFALLKVNYTNEYGAFLAWGLEKDLFVPFREQIIPMEEGKSYLVYCYFDEYSGRLAATTRLNKFLDNTLLTVQENEEVDLIISHMSEAGINVIINKKHRGLLYRDEVFTNLRIGDQLKGYIKYIRPDQKIDVTLQKIGYQHIEDTAQILLSILKKNNGFISLSDQSTPEDIRAVLQMSKKTFKKAVGNLFKLKLIQIKPNGIELL